MRASIRADIETSVKFLLENGGLAPGNDAHLARIEAAENIKLKPSGNPDLKFVSFFTDFEMEVFAENVREYSRLGFQFSEPKLREIMQGAVRIKLEQEVRDFTRPSWIDDVKTKGGDIPDFGYSFMKRFEEKHDLKLYKTSAIAPERAAQAQEEVAQKFQDMISSKLRAMNTAFPLLFPWKTLSEVPDANLSNMDEVAENGESKRERKLCTDALLNTEWIKVLGGMKKDDHYIKRMFEVALGDKGDKLGHRTLAVTTCGNGKFSELVDNKDGTFTRTPGACAPVLIYPSKGPTAKFEPNPLNVTADMTTNIYDKFGKSSSGIKVFAQPKGSMTLVSFPLWCEHFVDNLPRGPDGISRKNAEFQILFLDGHSSRWSVEGLEILKKNNVLAFCLPSHTSIWGQPNDAGANKALHKALQTNQADRSIDATLNKTASSIPNWNRHLVKVWGMFVNAQHAMLSFGSNNITDGWKNVGLLDGNILSAPYWKTAIHTLGRYARLAAGSALKLAPTGPPAAGSSASAGVGSDRQLIRYQQAIVLNPKCGAKIELRRLPGQVAVEVADATINRCVIIEIDDDDSEDEDDATSTVVTKSDYDPISLAGQCASGIDFNFKAPLSDDESQRAQAALNAGAKSPVVTLAGKNLGGDVIITGHDISTLREGEWIGDEVLNGLMRLLTLRDEAKCREEPTLNSRYFCSSFFMSKLATSNGDYSGISKWLRLLPGGTYKGLELCFLPINVNESHWTAAAMFPLEKRVEYIDSLRGSGRKFLRLLKHFLADQGENVDEWDFVHRNSLLQTNSTECGAMVIGNACSLADNSDIDLTTAFTEDDCSTIRKRAVLGLLSMDKPALPLAYSRKIGAADDDAAAGGAPAFQSPVGSHLKPRSAASISPDSVEGVLAMDEQYIATFIKAENKWYVQDTCISMRPAELSALIGVKWIVQDAETKVSAKAEKRRQNKVHHEARMCEQEAAKAEATLTIQKRRDDLAKEFGLDDKQMAALQAEFCCPVPIVTTNGTVVAVMPSQKELTVLAANSVVMQAIAKPIEDSNKRAVANQAAKEKAKEARRVSREEASKPVKGDVTDTTFGGDITGTILMGLQRVEAGEKDSFGDKMDKRDAKETTQRMKLRVVLKKVMDNDEEDWLATQKKLNVCDMKVVVSSLVRLWKNTPSKGWGKSRETVVAEFNAQLESGGIDSPSKLPWASMFHKLGGRPEDSDDEGEWGEGYSKACASDSDAEEHRKSPLWDPENSDDEEAEESSEEQSEEEEEEESDKDDGDDSDNDEDEDEDDDADDDENKGEDDGGDGLPVRAFKQLTAMGWLHVSGGVTNGGGSVAKATGEKGKLSADQCLGFGGRTGFVEEKEHAPSAEPGGTETEKMLSGVLPQGTKNKSSESASALSCGVGKRAKHTGPVTTAATCDKRAASNSATEMPGTSTKRACPSVYKR